MSLPELPEPELGYIETDKSRQPAFSARQMRAALQAQPAEVERETTARREAQEQLYAARERHTAEVKKLQAEIGRLQALRPVAMTPSEVTEAFDSELRSSYTDFEAGIRTAESHHHITQKEQGK